MHHEFKMTTDEYKKIQNLLQNKLDKNWILIDKRTIEFVTPIDMKV
jgi:hypothetical protein